MRARSRRRDLLPFDWFRRKKSKDEKEPEQPPAAREPDQPVAGAAPPGREAQQDRTRRQRGSRGGRSRSRKPADARPAVEAKQESKPEKREEQERKPAAKSRRTPSTRRRAAPRRAPLPPAKRELLVSVDIGEQRVAVLENDRVAEVYLERPEKRSIAGNIYKGVVDNVLPGMEAAFVEIGLEKNGFLYVDEIVGPELEGRRHGRKIQDLLSRGEQLLVQAVKDPMKTKGARLTTEISLPGRFVVFVPSGEGLGVSRRLEDDERSRLRDILKAIAPKEGGLIVRTAAEGASAEDIARDLDFLQRLWKAIQAQAKGAKAPALVYQEAELPLRVVRDLFTGDFERALVDHDRTYKRIVGYLKKTSPHMVERVTRHREKTRLFETFGVDAEIQSTLSRRVDLPSGGYLIFDYAEAFTVVDVNTGRFVGGRGKNSNARLEDTITKNNLEAVKEVVRQLRLRDIGGIIVIDFIDMANPKNRQSVEEALRQELERDRTKTYVVEISPLGLVEMTRQNVTDGPREILTRKCPTCAGDGIVYSDRSAAVDAERKLRELAARPRAKAFRVELNAHVASMVIGAGATRLVEIEALAKKRFQIEARDGVALDHFVVLKEGTIAALAATSPVEEGAEIQVKLDQVGLHDVASAIGTLDGLSVCVGDASKLVGKKVQVRIVRVLDGIAYATLVDPAPVAQPVPLTAEAQAEKPTRAPRKKKGDESEADAEDDVEAVEEVEVAAEAEPVVADAKPAPKPRQRAPRKKAVPKTPAAAAAGEETAAEEAPAQAAEAGQEPDPNRPKKRTRRGSRGGRGRKRKPAGAATEGAANGGQPAASGEQPPAAEQAAEATGNGKPEAAPVIHVPSRGLGRDEPAAEGADPVEASAEAAEGDVEGTPATTPKRRSRRGSRGGRNRRKKPVAAGAEAPPAEPDQAE
jgi:ribonuclease G